METDEEEMATIYQKMAVKNLIRKPMKAFVSESNLIEGIKRVPTKNEIDAHVQLVSRETLTLADLSDLVGVCTRSNDEILRDREGMNVVIIASNGAVIHRPPRGGPDIAIQLQFIIGRAHSPDETPYEIHQCYEALHPYMDGNGRSGRALWAWMMIRQNNSFWGRGFLHTWYYQSLEAGRKGPQVHHD